MTQWEKLLKKLMVMPSDMRFDELERILKHYGYKMSQPKSGSSHYVFRKQGFEPITIPKHKTLKKVYIQKVKDIVTKEEENI